MGSCFSCRSSSSASIVSNNVRLVHLNGYVEDFACPVSVKEVTGNSRPSKHFVCTAAQLFCSLAKPLNPEAQLQPGQTYFLLPCSSLKSDASPLDFAAVVKKLTSIAKSTYLQPSNCKSSRTVPILNSPAATTPNQKATDGIAYGMKRSNGGRSWKPLLDTIRERSFTRRSESEVMQEMQLEIAESK